MIVVFWVCAGLLVYAQAGYGVLLWLLARPARTGRDPRRAAPGAGRASLIVAAHNEERVIASKVRNARELVGAPEVIVCCDGCTDGTARAAREAGADLVLELPRGGKIRAQDAGVRAAAGELLLFSDANSAWERDALERLAERFAADARVGYACGHVSFERADGGDNQEGLYWRYETQLREWESRLASITAGNGAIYATRRTSYLEVDPIMGHDLSFPFNMVKRGWRAVYVPAARASERMVPTIDGEFARKRRMMSHTWPIVLRGGMLSPRGYGPLYAWMIFSHRLLRYLSPLLHVVAFLANALLLGHGLLYVVLFALQLALPAAAALAGLMGSRLLLLARYYVLTTASIALGFWDWLAHGTSAGWEAAEGHAVIRRLLDLLVAGAALIISSPVIALAALCVVLESRGGALYRQQRIGLDGRPFDVIKLRTMVDGAEHIGAGLAIDAGDARITRVGKLLRRTSIDELPNLVNVLRGEMSLIGPRPTLPHQVEAYDERQRGRLAVRPGITGWAQVNGRASLPWSERIELDLWYIEHRSAALDARILLRTVRVLFGGGDLYRGAAGGWKP